MAQPLVADELWETVKLLLPTWKPSPRGGRPVGDREALTGILFVLKTGISWEELPREMDCGCGMTSWRRLRDWQRVGGSKKLHRVLLAKLRRADCIVGLVFVTHPFRWPKALAPLRAVV